jgi:hypothetical protein
VQGDTIERRPLFPRFANTLVRLGFASVFLCALAIPACFMLWARTAYTTGANDPRTQPLLFDHRHHVRDDGIDCRYCHDTVDKGPYAGVPPIDRCMGCHAQIWNDAPILERLRHAGFDGAKLQWVRVHALPAHVYFDHSAHVTRGVGCATCHGRVDRMAQVWAVAPLTMGWCIDCHRDPDPWLRPVEHVTDMEWKPSRPAREVGREVRERLGIAPPTNCTGCHR